MQTIFYSSPRKRTSKHHRPSNNITKVSSQVYGLGLRVLNLITADGAFCVLKRVLATHHPSFQACKLGKKQAHCLRKTQRERGCVCEREKSRNLNNVFKTIVTEVGSMYSLLLQYILSQQLWFAWQHGLSLLFHGLMRLHGPNPCH